MEEIRPKLFKPLDVVGLSWLTCLRNTAWTLGTVPSEWQTGVVVLLFKKGDQRDVSFSGKVYSRALERIVWLLVEPRLQEDQCVFHPVCGKQEGMRISTYKSEVMILSRVDYPLQVGGESIPQWRSSSILGSLIT